MNTPPLLYKFTLNDQLFLWVNHLPHNTVFDTIALTVSGIGTAGIIWFLLGLLLFIREERKNHWFFAPILLAGGLSWVITEKILKPLFAHARPTFEIGAIIVGKVNTDYSFPSGHATIAFAMAVVLSRIEPARKWFFYTLAVLISFSRLYLGQHFPADVVWGALLGLAIGTLSLWIKDLLKKQLRAS